MTLASSGSWRRSSVAESPEGRCDSTQEALRDTIVQCEREYGHGGAHTATIDDPALDPLYTYVVSWWPKEQADA
jgi:hypothetical protein